MRMSVMIYFLCISQAREERKAFNLKVTFITIIAPNIIDSFDIHC